MFGRVNCELRWRERWPGLCSPLRSTGGFVCQCHRGVYRVDSLNGHAWCLPRLLGETLSAGAVGQVRIFEWA